MAPANHDHELQAPPQLANILTKQSKPTFPNSSSFSLYNNQRRFKRVNLKVACILKTTSGEITGYSKDMSAGGFTLIIKNQNLQTGTPLNLQFSFGNTSYLILSGSITSVLPINAPKSSTQRVGVKFSALRDFDKRILDSALHDLKQKSDDLQSSTLTLSIDRDFVAIQAANLSPSPGKTPLSPSTKLAETAPNEYRLRRSDLIPKKKNKDYSESVVTMRRNWLSDKTDSELDHVGAFSTETNEMEGNIENLIGVAQVPIGIAGPLSVKGQHAHGHFYVPLATTEGTLTYTYHHGMILVSLAGGARTTILNDELHISPIFCFSSTQLAAEFGTWLNSHFECIREKAESTTKHGKLLRIDPIIFDKNVTVKFCYSTGDAMGSNMITFATEEACSYILQEVSPDRYYLQSNFSSIKKPTFHNLILGCGKRIVAETVIPSNLLKRMFYISPKEIVEYCQTVKFITTFSGMTGLNGHIANGLSAIFLACGQDVASVVDSSVGITNFELTSDNSLYASVHLPSLQVGTVGGGTSLSTQQECLNLLGCLGNGKSRKFSEIVAATVLAGEISLCAKVAGGTFQNAHKKYGRKPLPNTSIHENTKI